VIWRTTGLGKELRLYPGANRNRAGMIAMAAVPPVVAFPRKERAALSASLVRRPELAGRYRGFFSLKETVLQVAANNRTPRAKTVHLEAGRAPERSKTSGGSQGQAFIGSSGWAYSSWKPEFYPQGLPQRKFLDYYSTRLNSVEVNYSFRRLPTAGMLASWLAASHIGFRFSFKAPQRITHILRLRDCAVAIADLSRALAPATAAGRMGVVLFQLPPNFKADVPRLDSFLADAKPHGMRIAFEFRHSSWFSDKVYDTLRQHGVALCIAQSDGLETPDVVTAPFTCYRFRKNEYSAAQLDGIEKTLRQRSAAGDVFAYFKHEEQPTGALRAVNMLLRLQSG
jgi:uncharacterized protein YecE (DUF72 family)